MASIQLEEIVWLAVDFAAFVERPQPVVVVEGQDAPSDGEVVPALAAESEPFTYRGRIEPDEEDEEVVRLFVTVVVDDPETDFALTGQMGARFRFPGATAYEEGQVRSTLMWVAYPYVREMVATVTGRSPHGAYFMAPMTRLPDPAAVEGASIQPGDDAG